MLCVALAIHLCAVSGQSPKTYVQEIKVPVMQEAAAGIFMA